MPSLVDILTQLRLQPNRPINGIRGGMPDYGYGQRWDEKTNGYNGSPKANGFLGVVQNPADWQSYSSEIGIGNDYGEHPSMIPGLTHRELVTLLTANEGDKLPNSIYDKADDHQAYRMLQGKSPWHGINDKQAMIPIPIPETSLTLSDILGRLR